MTVMKNRAWAPASFRYSGWNLMLGISFVLAALGGNLPLAVTAGSVGSTGETRLRPLTNRLSGSTAQARSSGTGVPVSLRPRSARCAGIRPGFASSDVASMHTALQVRLATREDATVFRGLRLAMLSESPRAFDAELADAVRLNHEAWLDWVGAGSSHHRRAAWVAWISTLPVGAVAASIIDDACHIGALWVDPEYRGSGIANRLLDAAETWCHDVRCSWNVLSVSELNVDAQRLYLRLQYEYTGVSKLTRWGHHELQMRKPAGR